LVERADLQLGIQDMGLGVDNYNKNAKDTPQNNFKIGYDTDGKFEVDFDINAIGNSPVANDRSVIEAWNTEIILNTQLENLSMKLRNCSRDTGAWGIKW
jgi:hypothetical protein